MRLLSFDLQHYSILYSLIEVFFLVMQEFAKLLFIHTYVKKACHWVVPNIIIVC